MGTAEMVAAMIGHADPLPAGELRALYPTRRHYLDRYEAACARLTAQGLLLEADARALLAAARDRALPHLPDEAAGTAAVQEKGTRS
jgi:hypothetical protein